MNLTRFHSLTLGLILCFSFRCMAQEQKLLTVISKIVSELAEETGEANAEMLTSLLFDLATEPAAINRGDSAEISRLFFLTPFQAATLVSYVRTTGPVVSFPELASLPGFNRESVESLMPFITLDIPPAGAPEGTGVYHRLLASASVRFQGGFADPSVNPIRNSLRYRLNSGSLTASLTAVSDAGEAPVWSGRPDFISGGVAVKGNMGIANFIAGDYNARFGMGLVINSGYKPFLTLTAPSYMGYRDGFSLSTSVNESNYLRGSAITMATRLFSVSGMASVRYRDARIETDTSGNIYAVILSTPPPHSSLSGVSATGVLRESSYGVNIGTVKGSFRWALTACYTEFSREVGEIDNSPGGIFRFSGSENLNAGVSYRMSGGKVSGAGEFAVSSSGGFAMAHTLNIRFDDRLTANLIYRYYDRQYYGHHAAGPGRNSITGNEEGLMARVSFEAARNVFLYAGTDIYRFPWMKTGLPFPTYGFRSELKATCSPSESISAEFRIYGGESMEKSQTEYGIPGLHRINQNTVRGTFSYTPVNSLIISLNALRKSSTHGEAGSMMAVDITFNPRRAPLSLWLRHAAFSTPSFITGIYLYENDMIYGFSVPVHHGEGSRTAMVAKIKLSGKAELRLKYAVTIRNSEYDDFLRNEEIKVQLTCSF